MSSRSGLARMIAVPLLVVLAGFVFVLATSEVGDSRGSTFSNQYRPSPPIIGETLTGDAFDLSDHRGRYVVVNFFATWCVPCIREHPELVDFERRHSAGGDADVVSVLYDTRLDDARSFFDRHGGDWPVVIDEDGSVGLSYGVSAVPESYLVGPDGVILEKLVGGVTAAGLDRVLAAYKEAM